MRIDRAYIISTLQNAGYQVYNVGENYAHADTPYIVVKAMIRRRSYQARRGFVQPYDIMIYTPDTSAVMMDKTINHVEQVLISTSPIIEIAGSLGMDFLDTEINMYMRNLTIEIPLTRRCC